MNSKQQDNVRDTAKQGGAKDSAYGNYQIAPNGDKISVNGNVTQIGSQKHYGEQSALDALRKMKK